MARKGPLRKPGFNKKSLIKPERKAIEPTRVYALRELPALLRVGRERVNAEVKAGAIVGWRNGNRRMFLGSALLDWIARQG